MLDVHIDPGTRTRENGAVSATRLVSMHHLLRCLCLFAATGAAAAADLRVQVLGVQHDRGEIRLLLFDREEGFRKEDKALRVLQLPARPGMSAAVVRDLPPGRYAVIAYHDENGDGRLNLRLGMFPKEGYGLSNDPKPLGPPKFADAAFDLPAAGLGVDVHLHY